MRFWGVGVECFGPGGSLVVLEYSLRVHEFSLFKFLEMKACVPEPLELNPPPSHKFLIDETHDAMDPNPRPTVVECVQDRA